MIYLVRHGEAVTQKEHFCIGRTDVSLSEYGIRQMELLGDWFSGQILAGNIDFGNKIHTSPLTRCYDSAAHLMDRIVRRTGQQMELIVHENLQEISMGAWDGLKFQEIKEKYPDEYKERGENIGEFRVEMSENYIEAGMRFLQELTKLAGDSEDRDMIVIAHAGVIRAALCLIEKRQMKRVETIMGIRQPNAGMTKLSYERRGRDVVFHVEYAGFRPVHLLDENERMRLYKKYCVPEHVIAHMRAVAEIQDKILQKTDCEGKVFDREVLRAAALFHDVARLQREHAKRGAEIMEKEGYDEIVPLIASHHSPDDKNESTKKTLTAADILFYADKLIQGERWVGVEERFRMSLKKCKTEEAVCRHQELLKRAKRIESLIGMEKSDESE